MGVFPTMLWDGPSLAGCCLLSAGHAYDSDHDQYPSRPRPPSGGGSGGGDTGGHGYSSHGASHGEGQGWRRPGAWCLGKTGAPSSPLLPRLSTSCLCLSTSWGFELSKHVCVTARVTVHVGVVWVCGVTGSQGMSCPVPQVEMDRRRMATRKVGVGRGVPI
ncbi:glycoprotein Xg isoform X1 [Nannospalax galili]|uniref:glycoprotein Xg isoform X1 n=1 Tax=Nannospalax galili TaxID=1026970 RepID=UPI00111BD6C5|nr:glycoprotein Xg isoform X1 [Nannospalax galili]